MLTASSCCKYLTMAAEVTFDLLQEIGKPSFEQNKDNIQTG